MKATPEQIDIANEKHGSTDIEIDNDADITEAAGGVWVSAWVWIGDEDA